MRPRHRIALARTALVLAFALVLVPASALASTYILDEAKIIPPDVAQRIDALSSRIESATPGAEIAVVTVSTLGDQTIEEYATDRFRELGIGSKDLNNGVLLLVAVNDRRVRIEVGYGLEGALPDSKAGMIIDSIIIPKFKEGDYAGGIEAGHAAIAGVVAEEYKTYVPGAVAPKGGSGLATILIVIAIVIGFFALISFLGIRAAAKAATRTGGTGTPGMLPPIAGPPPSSWSDSSSSSDSGSSSSSDWGSSGGSDFGGGSSGGGGASGSW